MAEFPQLFLEFGIIHGYHRGVGGAIDAVLANYIPFSVIPPLFPGSKDLIEARSKAPPAIIFNLDRLSLWEQQGVENPVVFFSSSFVSSSPPRIVGETQKDRPRGPPNNDNGGYRDGEKQLTRDLDDSEVT